MRILVTGITGFAGSHLAEFLLQQKGLELYGITRSHARSENIKAIAGKARLFCCDILNASRVRSVLEKIKPERIFHLAGQSVVSASWKSPRKTLDLNLIGTLNLFEAVGKLRRKPLIHVAGSAEVYGRVSMKDVPIKESTPLRPLNPYGVSKAAVELLGYQYFRSRSFPVVMTRAFNHVGPRQKEDFAASSFARQIALIEAGRKDPILHVGNLGTVRDFTDVRDVVRAYWLSLEKAKPGDVYNVCTGKGRRIGEILDFYIAKSKMKIKIQKDPKQDRPVDDCVYIGDASKFVKQTSWKPLIALEQTLTDTLNDWRKRIG